MEAQGQGELRLAKPSKERGSSAIVADGLSA
jgi:hypothetical protein